jgi:hypothetical protein
MIVRFSLSADGSSCAKVFAIIQSGVKLSQANAGLGKSISIVDHSRIEQIQKVTTTSVFVQFFTELTRLDGIYCRYPLPHRSDVIEMWDIVAHMPCHSDEKASVPRVY